MPAGLNHGLNRFKPEGGLNLPTLVQSPAVATQHLRPAGLGHVNPATASARPVLPALPCGEQSKHHVTRTNEATDNTTEGRSELLHPAQILHSPAHWVGRAGRVHIERPETEWHNAGRRWNPARFATSEVLRGRKRRVTCDAIMVISDYFSRHRSR